MDTLLSVAIGVLITFFFVWRYWRKSAAGSIQDEATTIYCPRCSAQTDPRAALCRNCRTPLQVWAGTSDFEAGNSNGQPRPRVNASLCIGCGACVEVCPEPGTLAMVDGKAILAQPDLCKSHGDCVSACPTSAIALLAGGAKQTLRVPATSADFETNVPGIFIIGELAGLGLIKTAINEGCRVAETIRRRVRQEFPEHDSAINCYDVLVVGAGPAGLSAGLSFHQYGLAYLVLEQGEIASTIRNYPRHKFLMEDPVDLPLFGKLVIKDSTKEALLDVWDRIVSETGVQITTNQRVIAIRRERNGDPFTVETANAVWKTHFVVLATGKRGSPRKLEVPGEDLAKVAYRLIEAETYADCDVAIAGGGDSAIEAALALSRIPSNRVTLIHRRGDFARLRERNLAKFTEAEKSGRIRVLRNTQIKEITPDSLVVEQPGGDTRIQNDYLFVLIGGQSPEAFLESVGIRMEDRVVAA